MEVFSLVGGLVAGIFGGGRNDDSPPPISPPPAPIATPTIDDAAKAREEADQLRRRKGRAATVLTGKKGAGTPDSATKTLLGE